MQHPIVECVTFNTLPEVTQEQLIATDAGVQEFVSEQPGFLYRSLTYNENSKKWMDIVYWQTQANAEAAFDLFAETASCQPMMALIAMESVEVQHWQCVSTSCSSETDQ